MLSIASLGNAIEWYHSDANSEPKEHPPTSIYSYKNAPEEKDNLIALDETKVRWCTVQ